MLRSDEIRKRLCGVQSGERLGPEGYTSDITERVYATMSARANAVMRGGHSVIVDAVYAKPNDRESIRRIAADAAVPFAGFWLDAPDSILLERLQRRIHDVSDADADVLRRQRAREIGLVDWHRVEAFSTVETVLQKMTAKFRIATRCRTSNSCRTHQLS